MTVIALSGWPLALVSGFIGATLGIMLVGVAVAASDANLKLRIGLLRRALERIGRGVEDPASVALEALAQDRLVQQRRDNDGVNG